MRGSWVNARSRAGRHSNVAACAIAGGAALLALAMTPRAGACEDHEHHLIGSPAAGGSFRIVSGGALSPLSALPAYNSYPASPHKLYLDFVGDVNNDWNGYVPGVTPAYDLDGDASTFNSAELGAMHEIWQRVSEKYSPFNVNVTTVDPGNLNKGETFKIVIGGDGKNGQSTYWAGDRYGGISWVNGFTDPYPNVSYVFPANLSGGDPKKVGEATSHEAGHGFGLQHQSVYNGTTKLAEYNPGTPDKAPVMGRSYDAVRGLWWTGQSIVFSQIQQDPYVLWGSLGLKQDEPGTGPLHAQPLTISGNGSVEGAGVITPFITPDADYFSFTTGDGNVSLTVTPFSPGGMLDASLALYDSSGNLIQTVATASLSETLSMALAAGTYEIGISGGGDVGDLGQYTISGQIVPVPEPATGAVVLASMVLLTLRRRGRSGAPAASSG